MTVKEVAAEMRNLIEVHQSASVWTLRHWADALDAAADGTCEWTVTKSGTLRCGCQPGITSQGPADWLPKCPVCGKPVTVKESKP